MSTKQVIMSFEEYDELLQYKNMWQNSNLCLMVYMKGGIAYIPKESISNALQNELERYQSDITALQQFKHTTICEIEKEIQEKAKGEFKWYSKALSFISYIGRR